MKLESTIQGLKTMESWLEDNINCGTDIIFDNDEDNTDSEKALPSIQNALAVMNALDKVNLNNCLHCAQLIQESTARGEVADPGMTAQLVASLQAINGVKTSQSEELTHGSEHDSLITNAMLSSLEGYASLILDSVEFELKRELTQEEAQVVYLKVEHAVELALTVPANGVDNTLREAVRQAPTTKLEGLPSEWAAYLRTVTPLQVAHLIADRDQLIIRVEELEENQQKIESKSAFSDEKLKEIERHRDNSLLGHLPADLARELRQTRSRLGNYYSLLKRADESEARVRQLELPVKLPAGCEINGFTMLIEAEVVARLQESGIQTVIYKGVKS